MRLEDLNQKHQDQARAQLGIDPLPAQLQETYTLPASQSQEEKELQRVCEQLLYSLDVEALHLSFKAREKKGWPDLTFCYCGTPFAIELKTTTGRVSKDQEHVLARMKANGWHTYVLRSYVEFKSLLENPNA